MQILDLLGGAPDLMDGLKGLGLSEDKISGLADGLGSQLGGGDGFDFTDLLTGLDADSFLSQLDVQGLCEKVGISPDIAQSALNMIAPKIAEFTGGGALGAIGDMAKGLFGKD